MDHLANVKGAFGLHGEPDAERFVRAALVKEQVEVGPISVVGPDFERFERHTALDLIPLGDARRDEVLPLLLVEQKGRAVLEKGPLMFGPEDDVLWGVGDEGRDTHAHHEQNKPDFALHSHSFSKTVATLSSLFH